MSETSPHKVQQCAYIPQGTALDPFHFTRTDLLIIASLYQQSIEVERPISVVRLLQTVIGQNGTSLSHSDKIIRLARDGILTLSRTGGQVPYSTGMIHAYYEIEEDIVQGYLVSLSKPFLGFLIDEQRPVLIETGFESNREFLRDAFRCCRVAQRYFNVPEDQWRLDLFDIRAAERYQNLLFRLQLTEIDIPFRNLISDYELGREEQLTLLHLVDCESWRSPTKIDQVSRVIDTDQFSREAINDVQAHDGTLFKHGFIEISQGMFPGAPTNLTIDQELFKYIVKDEPTQSQFNICKLGTKNSAITMRKPTKSMDQLILPDKEMGLLSTVVRSCETDSQRILQDWGIIQGSPVGSRTDNNQQTVILLYGRPGVGKTLAAEVIAGALNKEIMCIDISKIHDKWVGASEKNLRSVFTSYQDCLRSSPNPPVLLLNECDQFLSNRIERVSQAVDQMLNTMQNMLLEFLENFSGICIATTNLVTNLDPAFSRRFTHKIELPWPDSSMRKRLWETLIPASLPMDIDFDAYTLAEEYVFSGSQIRTVIYNTAQEVANRPKDLRFVVQSDLIKYAELERLGSFDGSSVGRIGFGQSEDK